VEYDTYYNTPLITIYGEEHAYMTEYKSLRLEKNEGVVEVVLIGPGKGNAMGPDFWREMPEAFAALDRDESARAIIVRGDGNNFSYGLDLAAMMGDLGRHFGAETTSLPSAPVCSISLATCRRRSTM
jgi:enoyl-CoA hydratase/carnithine racemase